jgi:hypothetical protein
MPARFLTAAIIRCVQPFWQCFVEVDIELFDEAHHRSKVPMLRGRHHGCPSVVRTSINVGTEFIDKAS